MRWPAILLTLLITLPAFGDGRLVKTEQQHPTRGIPRWKMYMDPADSSRVWLLIADNRDQLFLSEDGGESYAGFRDNARKIYDSNKGGEVSAWLDNHAALSGSGDQLWVTYPHARRVFVKTIVSPATSTENIGPGWEIETDPGIGKRSSLVATDKELFVFTRTSRDKAGNLRFFRYTHEGELLESGFVENMDKENIRIGATLDADGKPLVMVWSGSANDTSLRYFRWNGSSFEKPKDSLIWDLADGRRCDRGERTREFSFAVTDNNTLHVVWTCTHTQVEHAYKRLGQKRHWKYQDLVKHKTQREYDFTPMITTRGDEVHLLVTLDEAEAGHSNIWYARWDPATSAWSPLQQVTDTGDASIANTVWKLNADASSLPYMYWSGHKAVFTGRIPLH